MYLLRVYYTLLDMRKVDTGKMTLADEAQVFVSEMPDLPLCTWAGQMRNISVHQMRVG